MRQTPRGCAARRGAALVGVLVGLLGVLVFAAPASAHASLVRTSPVQNSIVQQAPSQVVVTFSEHVTPVDAKIAVLAPDGKRINTGTPVVSGNELRISVRTDVPRGTYLVSYRVISADSHPVGAGFTYSVGAPSQSAPLSGTAGTDAGSTSRPVAIGLAASRYLGYAGLILVAGPALVLVALWPRRLDRTGPTRLAYLGLGAIGLATLLELYLEAPYSNGTGLFDPSGLGTVLSSTFGKAHLIRLAMVIIAAVALRPFLAGRANTAVRALLTVAGVVAVGTWSVSGHAGTSAAPVLTVIADAAHLASMAIWIGGLLMLTLFLLRRANARELSAILPVWSNWAGLAVLVLVLAGTAQALVEIGTVGVLFDTTYGRLVVLKIVLLGAVLLAAALSRRMVTRVAVVAAPAGEEAARAEEAALAEEAADDGAAQGEVVVRPGALRRMRRSVLVEVLGAVLIIGAAAALVQTTPSRSIAETSATQNGSDIFSTTLTCSLYQLQLDIEPTRQGNNDVHLYAYSPTGVPLPVKQWTVSAALPGKGIEPISVPMLPLTQTHATGSVTLPSAGDWQFSFTLRTTEIDEATVRTVVPVR